MSKGGPLAALRASLTREQQIALCYRAGNTITEIATAFEVTKQRVYQILRKQGVTRDENPVTRNKNLYAFVGAHITKELKADLEHMAEIKHLSVSAYIAQLIKDGLDAE